MKILVCISKTPDTTSRIAFTNDNKTFDASGITYIMNPYDEWYALVRGIELKEKFGGTVTVIHVGDATGDIIIRKALAIGADDAVRIDAEATSALFTAAQIAAHAVKNQYDVVLLGKETIDYNGGEVGGMVSELLGLPYFPEVSKLSDESENTFLVTRDIEGGVETCRVSTPFVLSASKGLAEQRIPNMQGIMMSKRKPLAVEEAVDVELRTGLIEHRLPPAKSGVKLLEADQMDELVRLLHEEAKVI